jgi:hypothetical protein
MAALPQRMRRKPMSNTPDTFTAYQKYVNAQKEANAHNKTQLFDALAAAGATHVCVSFDGEGDSGQIDNIAAYKGDEVLPLPERKLAFQSVSYDGNPVPIAELDLTEAIERLCYGYLSEEHGGWENNDGAFGEFTLDVASRTVELEFNGRFSDFTTSSHSF